MDSSNWRPAKPEPAMEGAAGGVDLRSQLPADYRQQMVNMIMETLKRHYSYFDQDGLQKLMNIAIRFEEINYSAATSKSDYLRNISWKMLTVESESQKPMSNTLPANSSDMIRKPQDSAMSTTTISANLNSIPMLNENNFKEWKDNVIIFLSCMDLDHALRLPKPTDLTAESTSDDKRNFDKWDWSNRMSLMIIKCSIPETFGGGVSEDITNAKNFLTEIEKRFAKNNKAETSTLLQRLISMKYKGKGNISKYIMEMSNIASKLKVLKLELSDDLLVHLVLLSLPARFIQFKVSYNCQKEKWTLNELISYCMQEEERLEYDRTESAHLASTSKGKGKKRKNEADPKGPFQKKQQKEKYSCFFCNKIGHVKKDCPKYHAWRAKKGLLELPKVK